MEAGTNPFKKDDPFLVEAVSGFVLGDIGLSNPKHDNLAYLGGSIASGLVPVVEWVATVRDVIANSWRGDWGTAGITLGAGLLSALPATVVADEVPEMAAKLGKFVRAYPGKVTDVAKYILKSIPDHSIRLLDEIYDGAASALKGKGVSTSRIDELVDAGIDLKKHDEGLDIYKSAGIKVGKNTGDMAEIIAGEKIVKATYKAKDGYTILPNVKLNGGSGGEFDHVVLKDGKVVAIYEVKTGENVAADALKQINKAMGKINDGSIGKISHNLKPEQFTGDIEKITIGPKNGVNYHQTLDFNSDELKALYNTAIKGGI